VALGDSEEDEDCAGDVQGYDDSRGQGRARQWRRKSYRELVAVLGDKWIEAQCMTLTPPPLPEGAGEGPTGKVRRPVVPVPFASQWSGGPGGSLAAFRVERIHAPLVKEVLLSNGMRPTTGTDWLVLWSGPRMRDDIYEGLHEFQRINHFPGSTELTRKDRLWIHFQKMAQVCGEEAFDFVPKTFIIPDEAEEFKAFYPTSDCLWIVKPHASSQGKGIHLLKDISELPTNTRNVVSQYVHNPLLIQGLKFDLRIYVLVTSFDPLRCYVYREGLTRFASKPYSTAREHLGDRYRHLTNYSINKKADNFMENQRLHEDNYGHKWSLSALNRHLRHVGTDVDLMWNRINDLIVKTLLSVEPSIARRTRENLVHGNCFELYGFDVLVDEDLKPWLLEVNLSPSLTADSPLDLQVKSSLVSDTFNLVGFRNVDRQTATTSRLRSRLLFLQREANENREETATAFPTSLSELGEADLKMMAVALDEMDRAVNFIRLYPTRQALKAYEPIAQQRGPHEAYRAQLLASLMYGPLLDKPSRPAAAAEQASSSYSAAAPGAVGGRGGRSRGAAPVSSVERPLDVDAAVAGAHCPDLAAAALRIVSVLGTKVSFRLMLMEYLVRVCAACAKLKDDERERLQRSGAVTVLRAFRQQVGLFLRVRATASGGASVSVPRPPEGSDVAERLGVVGKAALEFLARETWSGGSAPSDKPNLEKVGSILTLAQCAPPSFMKSVSGQRALLALSGLSVADLESILRSPPSVSELGPMLDDPRDLEDDSEVFSRDDLRRRLLSSPMAGPLTELHNAASARPVVSSAALLPPRPTPPPTSAPTPAMMRGGGPDLVTSPRARSQQLFRRDAGSSAASVAASPSPGLRKVRPGYTMVRSAPTLPPLDATARRTMHGGDSPLRQTGSLVGRSTPLHGRVPFPYSNELEGRRSQVASEMGGTRAKPFHQQVFGMPASPSGHDLYL